MNTPLALALSVADAAQAAGVSQDTIRRAIHATQPPFLRAKRKGSRIVIPVSELKDWIQSLPDA